MKATGQHPSLHHEVFVAALAAARSRLHLGMNVNCLAVGIIDLDTLESIWGMPVSFTCGFVATARKVTKLDPVCSSV